jgi:hypothetical protein
MIPYVISEAQEQEQEEQEEEEQEEQEQEEQEQEEQEQEEQEQEQEQEEQEDSKEEINLDKDDEKIITQLKECFEQILKDDPVSPETIESLKNMTQIQQVTFLFNKITLENYEENKELLYSYLNLCSKYVQKDIEDITKKLDIEDDVKTSEQLKASLQVYSNILLIKNTFGF